MHVFFRKRFFAGTPPAFKNLFAGTPLANKTMFAGPLRREKKSFARLFWQITTALRSNLPFPYCFYRLNWMPWTTIFGLSTIKNSTTTELRCIIGAGPCSCAPLPKDEPLSAPGPGSAPRWTLGWPGLKTCPLTARSWVVSQWFAFWRVSQVAENIQCL